MKIPIRNIYYLFLYAWAKFPDGSVWETGVDQSPDLPNLFARLLSDSTRRLLRRGLDRGYQTLTDELIGPRGRLRLDRMIKEATQLRGAAVCDYDELTHDVRHNQILKATLIDLGRCQDVESSLRHELLALSKRFHDVADLRLTSSDFHGITLTRNTRDYAFLLRLCEFVFRSLMPDERGVGMKFQKDLDDEVRMSEVFEQFLRNFYRLHRPDYSVRAESPTWHVSNATDEDCALLPRMITDITLRQPGRTVIIDAKYYTKPLARSQYGEKVRSEHLYQLTTYLQHERVSRPDTPLSGMLLYPDVGRSLRLKYRLIGLPVLVATVDLSRDWREVASELQDLLNECASAAFAPTFTSYSLEHVTNSIGHR